MSDQRYYKISRHLVQIKEVKQRPMFLGISAQSRWQGIYETRTEAAAQLLEWAREDLERAAKSYRSEAAKLKRVERLVQQANAAHKEGEGEE